MCMNVYKKADRQTAERSDGRADELTGIQVIIHRQCIGLQEQSIGIIRLLFYGLFSFNISSSVDIFGNFFVLG